MTSSRFSRRPRVQPKPKVCKPPPPPPLPPTPPPWPPVTIVAMINWDSSQVPPPDFSVHDQANLTWDPVWGRFTGRTPGEQDHVWMYFSLDFITGEYHTWPFAWRGVMGLWGAPALTGEIAINAPINLSIDPWPGLPWNHTLNARFTT